MPLSAVIQGFVPGALGRLVEMHGVYYNKHWNLSRDFECKIAAEMSNFLQQFDPAYDGFWTAVLEKRVIGTVAIDGRGQSSPSKPTCFATLSDLAGSPRLRCLIVDPEYAGQGIGRRLIDAALQFCRSRNYPQIELWTYAGLDMARKLYIDSGFELSEEYVDNAWGRTLTHQRFVLPAERLYTKDAANSNTPSATNAVIR